MWYDEAISSIFYHICRIENIAIIRRITSLRTSFFDSCCYSTTFRSLMAFATIFCPLASNFFFCTNITGMIWIFQVKIIFPIYLDNVAIFHFVDNIRLLQGIVWIPHNQLFTDNRIIRDFPIIIMIMITVRSYVTLVCNFDNNLFRIDSFFCAHFIRRQILCLLALVCFRFSIYISNTVIFLARYCLMTPQLIATQT